MATAFSPAGAPGRNSAVAPIAITERPPARPSMPSVMFTALAVPTIAITASGNTSQGVTGRKSCGPPCTVASQATGSASRSWIGNLSRAGMPRVPTRSLLRSSAKPIRPPAINPPTAGSAPGCPAIDASPPPRIATATNRIPPPVGVPAFCWCVSGSSSWMTCPERSRRSARMVGG